MQLYTHQKVVKFTYIAGFMGLRHNAAKISKFSSNMHQNSFKFYTIHADFVCFIYL